MLLAVVLILFVVARLVARPKKAPKNNGGARRGWRTRPAVDLVQADPLVEMGPVRPQEYQ